MISSSNSFFNTADPVKEKQSFQIRAEQDFIFSGREFVNFFLEKQIHKEVSWFVQDGDCVLRGQVPLRFFTNESINLSSLLESLCYFSGIATLTRCYTESAGDFTVVGSILKDSPFPDWQKKAIHIGGGITNLSFITCSSEKNLSSLIKKNPQAIALDVSVFSELDCITYLKEIPKEIKRGICGPILPENLMKFLSHPLDFIMPSFLQGNFPSVKMTVTAG